MPIKNPLLKALAWKMEDFGDSPVHALNDVCLEIVFSYLPHADRVRIERVCKRWQRVSKQSWRYVKALNLVDHRWNLPSGHFRKYVDYLMLEKVLMRCGKYLIHLNLCQHADMLDTTELWMIGHYCPNIKTLDVSHIPVSGEVAKQLSENCLKLYKISMSCDPGKVFETEVSKLFAASKNLKYLNLYNGFAFTGECLSYIPKALEEMELINCYGINPFWLNSALSSLNLRSLKLDSCPNVEGSTLKVISKMKNLTHFELVIRYQYRLSISCMYNLSYFSNLESLRLEHKTLVTDNLLIDIICNCKKLESIDISDCKSVTNFGVTGLIKRGHNLIKLNVLRTKVNRKILKVANQITEERKKILTIYYLKDLLVEEFTPTSQFLQIIYQFH